MSTDEPVPASTRLYDYRGRRYEEHSHDPDSPYERRFALESGWRREDLPDATEFGGDPEDPWASIPASLIEATWWRSVRGVWRGCLVSVGKTIRHGADRGRVAISYAGTNPAEANAAGFIANPYQYWTAIADPAELTVTDVMLEAVSPN